MYSLHQTYFLTQKRLEQKLVAAKGISFSQFLILLGIHCNKKEPSQTAIADFLYLTEATVSRHVSALEAEKYLTRKTDPTSRRRHILAMTAKGSTAFSKAHAVIEKELHETFSIIPAKHRGEISAAFETVIHKLLHKS